MSIRGRRRGRVYDTGNCGYWHTGFHLDTTCPARRLDREPRLGDTVIISGNAFFSGMVGVVTGEAERDETTVRVRVTLPSANYVDTYPPVLSVQPIEPGPLISQINEAAAVDLAVDRWLADEVGRLIA